MFRITSWSATKSRIEIVPIMSIQQQRQLLMSNWTTSSNVCHLKRSNAVRIKGRNFGLLPKSLQQSILAIRSTQNQQQPDQQQPEESPSLLEQIRQGVQLRSVDIRSDPEIRPERLNETESGNYESMSEALARALERRHQVMQQTDDEESELSSIDSQDTD